MSLEIHAVPRDLYYHEVAYVRGLEKIAQEATRAWNKLHEMYNAQDRELKEKGEIGSIHRDVFEAWLDGLVEDAKNALANRK